MTEEEKLSAASEYFSNHPQSDAWKNADDPLRRGALRIAELDVAISFGFGDLPDAPKSISPSSNKPSISLNPPAIPPAKPSSPNPSKASAPAPSNPDRTPCSPPEQNKS